VILFSRLYSTTPPALSWLEIAIGQRHLAPAFFLSAKSAVEVKFFVVIFVPAGPAAPQGRYYGPAGVIRRSVYAQWRQRALMGVSYQQKKTPRKCGLPRRWV
jgi:hypothetical protein